MPASTARYHRSATARVAELVDAAGLKPATSRKGVYGFDSRPEHQWVFPAVSYPAHGLPRSPVNTGSPCLTRPQVVSCCRVASPRHQRRFRLRPHPRDNDSQRNARSFLGIGHEELVGERCHFRDARGVQVIVVAGGIAVPQRDHRTRPHGEMPSDVDRHFVARLDGLAATTGPSLAAVDFEVEIVRRGLRVDRCRNDPAARSSVVAVARRFSSREANCVRGPPGRVEKAGSPWNIAWIVPSSQSSSQCEVLGMARRIDAAHQRWSSA